MLSHAPLLSEEGAGGALLFAVAVVEHWNQTWILREHQRRQLEVRFSLTRVVALVSSGAHVFALGGFGAAGDGGVQDGEATVTRQLVKTCGESESREVVRPRLQPHPLALTNTLTGLPAGVAVATVTGLLAAVKAAVELVAADLEALVFSILEKTTFI